MQKNREGFAPIIDIIDFLKLEGITIELPSEKTAGDSWTEDLKEKFFGLIEEEYRKLRDKLSELRKAGKEVGVLSIKLMKVPLKIALLRSDFSKEDFIRLFNYIKKIKADIALI